VKRERRARKSSLLGKIDLTNRMIGRERLEVEGLNRLAFSSSGSVGPIDRLTDCDATNGSARRRGPHFRCAENPHHRDFEFPIDAQEFRHSRPAPACTVRECRLRCIPHRARWLKAGRRASAADRRLVCWRVFAANFSLSLSHNKTKKPPATPSTCKSIINMPT
jgi:hypothetical protein